MRNLSLAITCLLLAVPTTGQAAQYHIQASTVGDGYQLLTPSDEVVNRRRLHQYLGLGVHDLMGDGGYKLSFVSLMRFDADFALEGAATEDLRALKDTAFGFQTGYLEGRGFLSNRLDFRIGRQLHADPIDFLMLDGLSATYRLPGHLGIEVLAGLEANDFGTLTSSQFELDGVRILKGIQDDAQKVVAGAALVTHGFTDLRARVGYRRIMSRDFLERTDAPSTLVQGEGDTDTGYRINQEKVGGALYWRLFGSLHLDAAASYDFYNDYLDTFRGGLRWQATDAVDVQLQYVRLLPSFDADSIFNIFSSEPLNDVNARTRLYLHRNEWVYAGGMLRLFGNEACRDESKSAEASEARHQCVPEGGPDQGIEEGVSGYGAMAGWHRRYSQRSRAGLDISYEDGYGGKRLLVDLGTTYSILPGELDLDGRVTVLQFQDQLQPNLGGTGIGYQVGGTWTLADRAALRLLAEHNFNRNQTNQFRLFVMLDLDFHLQE